MFDKGILTPRKERMFQRAILYLFVLLGRYLFPLVDIYAPGEDVVGLTFACCEEYLGEVHKIAVPVDCASCSRCPPGRKS